MICDNCQYPIDGPPFGKVGETLCWECYSRQTFENEARRATATYTHTVERDGLLFSWTVPLEEAPAQEAGR